MARLLLLLCVLFLGTTVRAESPAPTIDLDTLESVNLLADSQYVHDEQNYHDFTSVSKHDAWQPLDREQLKFGMIEGQIWLKSEIRTVGHTAVNALLEFDRQIDFIGVQIEENGNKVTEQQLGAFLKFPTELTGTNKNLIVFELKPERHYQFLIKISGSYAINGPVNLWEKNKYHKADQLALFFMVAYIVTVLMVSLYNTNAFFATGYKAFVYHAIYGLSLMTFQLSQYGYLDFILGDTSTQSKEQLMTLTICVAYTAILLFIITVVEHKKDRIYHQMVMAIIIANFGIALISPLISFKAVFLLFILTIIAGSITGIAHVIHLFYKKDSRAMKLLILLTLFAPSPLLLGLSRFGILDHTFLTENLIQLIVIVEMVVISVLLFNDIRERQQLFWRSQFLDPGNQLPNIVALRRQMKHLDQRQTDYALSYLWFSGLERIEISRGSAFRDRFLKNLSEYITLQLDYSALKLKNKPQAVNDFMIFYGDKNTLGILTNPLTKHNQQDFRGLLEHAFNLICLTLGYNLDISLVLASSNSKEGSDTDSILQKTQVALAQCIQTNQKTLLYNREIGEGELRRINLLNSFEQALEDNQFYLEWQPQIDTQNQTLSGLETLVRWRHPEYGMIPPNNFIPMLEQSDKITALSLWIIRQVFDVAPAFIRRYPDIDISINLSVYDLMSKQLIPTIDQIMATSEDDIAKHIMLEITESVHMEDNATVLAAVHKLQQRGFRISIDDFGAGYASFGYLQTLPANELKIDQRYARSLNEPNSQAIVKSIIDLALRLNMSIVVEGVETAEQQAIFTQLGAHRLQGWQLGKPTNQQAILDGNDMALQPH